MKSKRFLVVVVFVAALAGPTAAVHADGTLGVFCWNQQPFTDVVCFDVEPRGPFFALTGDDTDSDGFAGLVDGTAKPQVGQIDMEFTQTFPNGVSFENYAIIDGGTLSGTWVDDFGGSGAFTFVGTASAKSSVQGGPNRKDSGR